MPTDPQPTPDLSSRLRELEAREAELTRRELKAMARAHLAKKGLGEALLPFLDYSGRDQCLSSLDRLTEAFAGELARRVDKRLSAPGKSLPAPHPVPDEDALSDKEYYERKLKKK